MDIKRSDLKNGSKVEIEVTYGEYKKGKIKNILSKGNTSKGIKVELSDGTIGRVIKILTEDDVRLDNFKFLNIFFYERKIFAIWNCSEKKYEVVSIFNKKKNKNNNYLLLFSDIELAKKTTKGTQYEGDNYRIVEINRRKKIYENFNKLDIDFVKINMDKTATFERFIELEEKFLKMK